MASGWTAHRRSWAIVLAGSLSRKGANSELGGLERGEYLQRLHRNVEVAVTVDLNKVRHSNGGEPRAGNVRSRLEEDPELIRVGPGDEFVEGGGDVTHPLFQLEAVPVAVEDGFHKPIGFEGRVDGADRVGNGPNRGGVEQVPEQRATARHVKRPIESLC